MLINVKKNKKTSKKPKVNGNKVNYKPTISVCLIVKDEERFLDNCLKSVKDIADEIIIIDTGSQDNSVSIAKKYTNKVYFHPWQENFAEARNHYFEYAKGEWILHIDADEELANKDIPVLLKAVKDHDVDLILIPIISHLEKGGSEGVNNGERLFRNNGVIHYEGRIHERLTGYKKAKIYPAHLIHYGYDLKDDKLSEEKHQRRIRLLNMDIQDDPNNPLPWHYLSCCYLYRDLFDEAINAGLKAVELADKNKNNDPIFLSTRYNIALSYYGLKKYDHAKDIALSAIELNKNHVDSYYILAALYFELSDWTEVIKYGLEYIRLCSRFKSRPEDFGTMVLNSFGSIWKIQILMGIASNETGDISQSKELFRTALSKTNNQFNALKTIGVYYYNKALFEISHEYLIKAIDLKKDDQSVKELLDNIRSGRASGNTNPKEKDNLKKDPESLRHLLSKYISDRMPEKAMETINSNSDQLSVHGSVFCRIAVLFLEKGDIESGLKCYMAAVEKNPELSEAWESLGELMLAMNKPEDAKVFFDRAGEIDKKRINRTPNSDSPANQPYPGLTQQKTYLSSNNKALTIVMVDIPQNISKGDYVYRTFTPGMALSQEKDVYVVSISNIHPQKFDVINNADVLILNNVCDPDLLPIIKKRKDKKLLTVYELSDDLNAIQPWNAIYDFYQNKENISLIYRMANYCDKLQFSTHELHKIYGMLNPVNKVFPNQILDLPPERVNKKNNDFIIGWGGSHGHLEDIASISEQLIRWVTEKQDAKLYIMGSREIQDLFRVLPDSKKRYFTTGSLQDYYTFLSKLDVGIAPLRDTAFNRCRSDVKFLEYAISGVTPVLSDLEPYRDSVVHGETGFLFKDSAGMLGILDLLINNRSLLKEVSGSAKRHVINHRLQKLHNSGRLDFYQNELKHEYTNIKSDEIFEKWCSFEGAVKNERFLILSNTEFEKNVYSGLALMQDSSHKEAAKRYFEEASRLEPQNYLPFLYSAPVSPDPLIQLKKAIKLEPLSIKAHILIGEELTRQGNIPEAILSYQRAIEIFPEYDTPLIRAANLSKFAGDHYLAEQLLKYAANYQLKTP